MPCRVCFTTTTTTTTAHPHRQSPRSKYGELLRHSGEAPVAVRRVETVEEVLRDADVVSLHCNLDADTRHLINAERLKMMKPDAVLVNAARGPCVDEAALVAHMKANPNFRAGEWRAEEPACVCVCLCVWFGWWLQRWFFACRPARV